MNSILNFRKSNKVDENLKPGDYVLLTRWSDMDPHDPWAVCYVGNVVIREPNAYNYATTSDQPDGYGYRHYRKITAKQGKLICDTYIKK